MGRTAPIIVMLVCSLLVMPHAARAQQAPKLARVGVLLAGAPPDPLLEALRDGLRELGYVEGQNLSLVVRYAEGKNDRLPALAGELAQLKVDVLTTASTPAALAAKQATGTIPIVFLATDRASFIYGAKLAVDRGAHRSIGLAGVDQPAARR